MESLALTITLIVFGIYTALLGVLSLIEAKEGKKANKELKTAA